MYIQVVWMNSNGERLLVCLFVCFCYEWNCSLDHFTHHTEKFPEAVASLECGAGERLALLKVTLERAGQRFGCLILERVQVIAENDRVLHGYVGA